MIRLIFHTGPRAGTEVTTSAESIRIGRNPEHSDVVLADAMASQRHCQLTRTPQGVYMIEDLGSTHGTLVNRQPIQKALLAPGDQFWVGGSQIEVGEGRPRLFVTRGKMAGVEVPIGLEAVTIGSGRDNLLVLPEAPNVDQHHAMLLCLPTGFALQDNRSNAPTFVNGTKIDRYVLVDGDVITIGDNDVRFLIGASDGQSLSMADSASSSEAPEPGVRATLYFVSGPHEKLEVPLADKPVTFGRRGDCTVVLSDPHASGLHCQVTWIGNGYQLAEIKATYGTFVNGQRISQPVVLAPGDVIGMGSSVAEFRLVGGAAVGVGEIAMTTVIAEGAYTVAAKPKFVIEGSVLARDKITIGRAAGNDIFLQEDEVSRVHCEIRWDGHGFVATDKSKAGTYIGSRRIVEEKLQEGHVLRIGPYLWNVLIRGDRCQLEKIDAEAALAAIEVARETQFDASKLAGAQGAGGEIGYKTMFKADLADVDAMVAERKNKLKKKGAPMWRPTTDIQKKWRGPIAVSSSVAAALAVCAYFVFTGQSGAALLNHPLSQAHASKAFVAQAGKLGGGAGAVTCTACHSAGAGAPDAKCQGCHAGFKAQPKHFAHTGTPAGKVVPGACSGCHQEHRGGPRGESLGATVSCKSSGCHPDAHAKELAVARTDAPFVLKAPKISTMNLTQQELHLKHAHIEGRCISCHGTKDGQKSDAKKACFRCHTGGAELATLQCRSCHIEHEGSRLAALTDVALAAPAAAPPTPVGSAGRAGVLALAVFSPLFLIGLVLRSRSRRHAAELVAKMQEIPAESFKRLVHSINVDKCVGCSMCVTACPASVLELVNHKSTIVNFDACIQCKKCEVACNFDALRMHDADKPPPMVEMPDVDAHNETPVPGLYLIGQAAGNPQIKNAANIGTKVIAKIARTVQPGSCARLGAHCDVLIVGAGPGGLSTAISAAEKGFTYGLLEKGATFAGTQANYYFKGKHVMAEPNDVKNISRLPVFDGVRETMLEGWQKAIEQYRLQIRYNENVVDVKKDGEVFVVKTADREGKPLAEYRALRVVLAIGTMANPRKLGCPGENMAKVKNALVDPDEFVGKNILVVGGGDAGIEVALALGPKNKVYLSVRGAGPERIKPGNKKKIDEAIAAGVVQARFSTTAAGVEEGKAMLKHGDGRIEELPNDVVFAMIGGIPPVKWLQGLGVPYVNKPHSWSPARSDQLDEGAK
jgi:pSer/pThr/pTyr-binding forkhead associated (FHA) protein/thioredoxin reductase/formate hydrogenlyase subunit 6/NADH:ubiquinone oxidoreductase subunit I